MPIVFGLNSAMALHIRKAISQLTTLRNEHQGICSDVVIICYYCAQKQNSSVNNKIAFCQAFGYLPMEPWR